MDVTNVIVQNNVKVQNVLISTLTNELIKKRGENMNYKNMSDNELHDEIIRLKQEASEVCGLTEGDLQYKRSLECLIVKLQLIIYNRDE